MIYLLRISATIDMAVCEDVGRVAGLLAQGYTKATRRQYMAAWQAKDRLAMFSMRMTSPPPKERAVGSSMRWHV